MKQKDWGYNQEDVLVIELHEGKDFEQFKSEIETNTNVVAVAGSKDQIGYLSSQFKVEEKGESFVVDGLAIGSNYLDLMGIRVLDGRSFQEGLEADSESTILVNEAFRKERDWERAVGQTIKIADKKYTIVGEVNDLSLIHI